MGQYPSLKEIRAFRAAESRRPFIFEAAERQSEATHDAAIVLTQEMIGLAQRHANASFNVLSKSILATSYAEAVHLGGMHSWNQFHLLWRESLEFGALLIRVTADLSEAALSIMEDGNGRC